MLILAIETCMAWGGVSLLEDGDVIYSYDFEEKLSYSRNIVWVLNNLVEKGMLELQKIDLLAASVGPGSYTGMRIGVTLVKVLGFLSKTKIIGINTMEAMCMKAVYENKDYDYFVPVIDATNNEVYRQVFKKEKESVIPWEEKKVLPRTNFLNNIPSGSFVFCNFPLEKNIKKEGVFISDKFYPATSVEIGKLAYKYRDKAHTNYHSFVPDYITKSSAERKYEERNKKNTNNRK